MATGFINLGGGKTLTGSALPSDVRMGHTFSSDGKTLETGTLNLTNLLPENIKAGVTVGGVAGMLAGLDNITVRNKTFTVTADCTLFLGLRAGGGGAAAGGYYYSFYFGAGGKGGVIGCSFNLSAGDRINISVGAAGLPSVTSAPGTSGSDSYVRLNNSEIIRVSGGGGATITINNGSPQITSGANGQIIKTYPQATRQIWLEKIMENATGDPRAADVEYWDDKWKKGSGPSSVGGGFIAFTV